MTSEGLSEIVLEGKDSEEGIQVWATDRLLRSERYRASLPPWQPREPTKSNIRYHITVESTHFRRIRDHHMTVHEDVWDVFVHAGKDRWAEGDILYKVTAQP